MALKIIIDRDLCQGHSVCMGEVPEVFDVVEEDEGYPMVKVLMENPPEELREKVMKAAKYCPNHVITVIDE
ncbi:ferredoxin [Oceanicoccus sp. KOV_DT_Chl]|uniref:ferredoxin n=1 Tax=Oceanicoccus sp. KOV_DT_Chl TaxID=1904639 RepID=UPI000C798BBB|nr:ferredoxin [Oceanicoccus sp. KOV_DT_Chl]